MKMILATGLVLLSTIAQAGVQFRSDSQLPDALKLEVIAAISSQCPAISENGWTVTETATSVRVDQVDNGLVDNYYTSDFSVFVEELDSNHSRYENLQVESILTEANNGTHYGVQSIQGCQSL